jgi:hypothetical protein
VVNRTGVWALKEVPKRMLILGGCIIGTHAGDMIGEIALAIEMGAGPVGIGKTIHPRPMLGGCIGMVAGGRMGLVPTCRRPRAKRLGVGRCWHPRSPERDTCRTFFLGRSRFLSISPSFAFEERWDATDR